MRRQQNHKIKALVLLLVFSLNTVVGFACSVGVNMGFNAKRCSGEQTTAAPVHIHKNGKQHIHQEKKKPHCHKKQQHHNPADPHPEPDEKKDNCCNDKVKEFAQADKSLPSTVSISHPVFVTAFLASFYNIALPHTIIIKDVKQFVRSYHPPIPDICIAIQSFRI